MIARILWLLVLLPAAQAERTTIIAHRSDPPMRNFRIIYYDDAFLFAGRDFGSANDPRGNTEPGLFVHSKQANRWIQITSISTAGGDFTAAANVPYIRQPLRTSGSIAFPGVIEHDTPNDRYVLRYFTSFDVPSAEVVLSIKRADLRAAFTR